MWPGRAHDRTWKKCAAPCYKRCAPPPFRRESPYKPRCPVGPCRGLDGVLAAREEPKAASPPALDQTQHSHPEAL
ncbi:hypothetical protein NDU88_003521 [Pleurodeles waltl]|uniref:Uncharacterized protein n=1 Tax=Pleurodeles waltl TaxID=8319 RepID=A0AAV7KX77_PLEWA|nr:hypothetical protein NDU88_003521 [Pleurodeles waltl]